MKKYIIDYLEKEFNKLRKDYYNSIDYSNTKRIIRNMKHIKETIKYLKD